VAAVASWLTQLLIDHLLAPALWQAAATTNAFDLQLSVVLWGCAVGAEGSEFFSQKDVAASLAAELTAAGGIISATDLATAAPAVREPLKVQVSVRLRVELCMLYRQQRSLCAILVHCSGMLFFGNVVLMHQHVQASMKPQFWPLYYC
jgi:hypothetical protein